MPFIPVFLWTDILIYLLVAVVILAVFYIRTQPHLRTPWQFVFKRKRGAISILILLVYASIGLLDSVHFRYQLSNDSSTEKAHYSTEVLTLLDLALTPMREQEEKTYSSPFATKSFVREMIYTENGQLNYIYPKLNHAGSHLITEQSKWSDIQSTVAQYTLFAFLSWLAILLLIILYMRGRYGLKCRELLLSLIHI